MYARPRQTVELRQHHRQVFGQTVAEVLVLFVGTHVDEGQDGTDWRHRWCPECDDDEAYGSRLVVPRWRPPYGCRRISS